MTNFESRIRKVVNNLNLNEREKRDALYSIGKVFKDCTTDLHYRTSIHGEVRRKLKDTKEYDGYSSHCATQELAERLHETKAILMYTDEYFAEDIIETNYMITVVN